MSFEDRQRMYSRMIHALDVKLDVIDTMGANDLEMIDEGKKAAYKLLALVESAK